MRCAFLAKSVQPATAFLVREKFPESTKLSIEHGWDSYPVMGRCPGKGAGRSNSHANSPLPFWH